MHRGEVVSCDGRFEVRCVSGFSLEESYKDPNFTFFLDPKRYPKQLIHFIIITFPCLVMYFVLCSLLFTAAVAELLSPRCNCHTWVGIVLWKLCRHIVYLSFFSSDPIHNPHQHNVTAYKGTWTATVVAVDEPASFVHEDCSVIAPLSKLNVSKFISPQFGFKPGMTE